jgi:hypothetical protein
MANIKEYAPTTGIGERLAEVQALKVQIDALEAKLDEHKAYLLGHAIRNNLDGLRLGPLTLSRRERPTWTYSDTLKAAEAKLKARKTVEQQNGTATCKKSEHLVVTFDAKAILASQLIEA